MRVRFTLMTNSTNNALIHWCDLDIIPARGSLVNVDDFVEYETVSRIVEQADSWSGFEALVDLTTLRKDEKGWYYCIWVMCEE